MKSIGKKKCLNDKKNSFKMMHKARKKQDKMMKNGFFLQPWRISSGRPFKISKWLTVGWNWSILLVLSAVWFWFW